MLQILFRTFPVFRCFVLCIHLCIQTDRKTGGPKLWIYKNKDTGRPKGDATVTYDDAYTATSAIEWFNSKSLLASLLCEQEMILQFTGKFLYQTFCKLLTSQFTADDKISHQRTND